MNEIGPALSAAWLHTHAARSELRAWQDARLRRLLVHAYESVPFYRRLFDCHRLHPRHIRGMVDLELIPLTDLAAIRHARPQQTLARGFDPAKLLSVRTSSVNGPLTIRRTWLEDKLQHLLELRAFRSFGVTHADRIVVVGHAGRSEHVIDGDRDPVQVAAELRAAQPQVLIGLPGLLDRLTAPGLANAIRTVRPRLVIVGGDEAAPALRLRIRTAFQAPLFETYASHECPLIAWECRHSGDLHTCDDGVLVEVLRDGRAVGPGERGEVVLTNLHAYAMPFIRYRIGDLATRGSACSCGAHFSTIGDIQRHTGDQVPLPDANLLHPYEIVSRMLGA